ncbi:MAG: flavin reductase family protein [Fibrobacteres bacterium]|nr:flavin reductase family protein [Fibrobacterota bacterium]
MGKISWKPGTMLYPLPVVMVTVGEEPAEYNIITIAWTGTVCSDPPMLYISVRPNRHSYAILKRSGEFVVNLTTRKLAFATDWAGVKSGKDYKKFSELKLTPGKADIVKAPIIVESPINIECKVVSVTPLGTHDMFIGEVVNVMAEDAYIDKESGAFTLAAADPICYSHGQYHTLGPSLGKFGFSVAKKKK